MLTRDFDYHLPEDRIAQFPAPRGESRLLVVDDPPGSRHRRIQDLPSLLEPGDLMVVNDTRVIPARLFARRPETGGRVELLLVEKVSPTTWDVLVKPGRKARPGARLILESEMPVRESLPALEVEILEKHEDGRHRASFAGPVEPYLETLGHIPLPPYIKRPDSRQDRELYQTVFARRDGAIAAPTAGLHFSDDLLRQLAERGVERTAVTLHVGIGTFKPVTADLAHEHRMESERWEVSSAAAEAIRACRQRGGRIVAVGTTVVRTLETAARRGEGAIEPGSGSTDLFIRPGFEFRAVDRLLTNFHLPRSTLLMLVSALAGRERILDAYREAIEEGYRFYSYGDAMLLDRRG
ncbi:MAG: tRNA preQ1(34) S-adenosylmethionine ribosyltransferase-isomerase QueA [Acidobacteria bacterium]|nr:tRNA preQ1(34) S-adenosylmethionine ribosyltransferase-isomerase QueA [Acidobacteriota bacterium]